MKKDPMNVRQANLKVSLLFGAMALVLAAGLAASFLTGRAALNAMDQVTRFDAAIERLQDLRSTMQDAETGQRGYLLTREAKYLEPYEGALVTVRKELETVQKMAESGLLPEKPVSELDRLIGEKIDELRKTVDLVKSGRPSAALEIVRGDEGKRMMDSIRDTIAAISLQQVDGRTSAKQAADSAVVFRGRVFLAAVIINLGFLAWAYRRIRSEIVQQYVSNLETQRQKEILAVTLSSIGDAVIITDIKGRITFLNGVAETLTGWTASEAEDRPCVEVFTIINEETRSSVESPVDRVLASGAIAGLANHTLLIRKDGSELPIDDSGAPIREADGTVRGVVLVFRDFTAHKNFERTLIQAKEEVEASSKAKDKFLATLSHELRTPLTPVLATLSVWEATRKLPPSLWSDLQLLRRNVELEARLIDDLLDLTRIDNGKLSLEKEETEVHGLIHSAVGLYQEEIRTTNLRLRLSLEARHASLEADPARLQQILLNIIGNALKCTPNGGSIEIATENPTDTQLTITITDSGIGMSAEVMTRLFRRFEQGDLAPGRKDRGLGLGLSIAKSLVEAHGGTLRADSRGPGHGSSFAISFPVFKGRAGGFAADGRAQTPAKERRNLRVLLLEDHEDTAHVMGKVLVQMGHEVETSATVAAASEKLRQRKFDVILSDIGLPDGTGIDFIRAAREICQTPAVALTGYGMAEDVEECLQAGFDEHLTKPVDIERLQKTLSKISEKRLSARD
jgi:PAS domain S-box-containing protein